MIYYMTLTNKALAKISAAIAGGSYISMSRMAIGDGNGTTPTPTPEAQGLVNEVYSNQVNSLAQDADGNLIAEMLVPMDVGGFSIREVALYDWDGELFAVGNMPTIDKPLPTDNSVGELVIRAVVAIGNDAVINLSVGPMALATQEWVEANYSLAAQIPGGVTGQILRKKSNLEGDTEWSDPTSVNVVVNTREETQTLTAGQTVVNLVTTNTTGLSVYIDGIRLPRSRYTVNTATRITLDRTYPAGTVVTAVQNEPSAQIEAFPVGMTIMLGITTTPAQLLGYGTWSRVAEGRAIFGLNSGDGDFNTLGKTGGSKTHGHTGSTGAAGSHNHQGSTGAAGNHSHDGATGSAGGHSHSIFSAGGHNHNGTTGAAGAHAHTTDTAGGHSHGGSTAAHTLTVDQIPAHSHTTQIAVNTGGGSGSTGLYQNTNYQGVVQLDSNTVGGGQAHAHGINQDGAHAHNTSAVTDHAHTIASAGDHTHSMAQTPNHAHTIAASGDHAHSLQNDGTHTHTVSVGEANNLPPYYTVALWLRTA